MVEVRDAERADVRLLKQLIDEMGGHERMIVSVTEDSLAMDSFGPKPQFRALIAEADRRVAGYALFFDCYSSFQGRGIFLEDLFVSDEFRGKRVGTALLSRVAEIAVELDCVGIMLNVLDWNESARRFFERAGASVLRERETLCLAGIALRKIAGKESAPATR
jgi:GNAT superfamily N-acetyltransferase